MGEPGTGVQLPCSPALDVWSEPRSSVINARLWLPARGARVGWLESCAWRGSRTHGHVAVRHTGGFRVHGMEGMAYAACGRILVRYS